MLKVPIYHTRPVGSRPAAVPVTSKTRSKVNVWGGISFKGPTPFACFECNLDAKLYRRVLSDALAPFAIENNILYLHQDNDRKHTSAICTKALKDFNIKWVCSQLKVN
jgi:hypothetical protein